jgi:hypothetical protein
MFVGIICDFMFPDKLRADDGERHWNRGAHNRRIRVVISAFAEFPGLFWSDPEWEEGVASSKFVSQSDWKPR